MLHDLRAIEERRTFGFAPAMLPAYLNGHDFILLRDAGAAEYRQLYLPERTKLNKGYEFYRVAMAQKNAS